MKERQDSRITQEFYFEQLEGQSSHLLIWEILQKEHAWGGREGAQYWLRCLSHIYVEVSRKKLDIQV